MINAILSMLSNGSNLQQQKGLAKEVTMDYEGNFCARNWVTQQ